MQDFPRLIREYPDIFGPAEPSAIQSDLIHMIVDSAAMWGHEMRAGFTPLLNYDNGAAYGNHLPEVEKLRVAAHKYANGTRNIDDVSASMIAQLTRFIQGPMDHNTQRDIRLMAGLIEQICDVYIERRWARPHSYSDPLAAYAVVAQNRFMHHVPPRWVLRWKPFTNVPYDIACVLLSTIMLNSLATKKIRTRPTLRTLHQQRPPGAPSLFGPINTHILPWVLDYPTAEHIPRARARMTWIHQLLPVQTADMRATLAGACRTIAAELTPNAHPFWGHLPSRATALNPWPAYVPRPLTAPWPDADAARDEAKPWQYLLITPGTGNGTAGFVPLNPYGEGHAWVSLHQARMYLIEREILRRYIAVVESPERHEEVMQAFAMSQHPRLGAASGANVLSQDHMSIIGRHIDSDFRPFYDDVFDTLLNPDDSLWR